MQTYLRVSEYYSCHCELLCCGSLGVLWFWIICIRTCYWVTEVLIPIDGFLRLLSMRGVGLVIVCLLVQQILKNLYELLWGGIFLSLTGLKNCPLELCIVQRSRRHQNKDFKSDTLVSKAVFMWILNDDVFLIFFYSSPSPPPFFFYSEYKLPESFSSLSRSPPNKCPWTLSFFSRCS